MVENFMSAAIAAIMVIMFLSLKLSSIEKRIGRLSQLDAKLDLLLKHAGLEFDPYENVSPAVVQALQRGEKIQAIKHYREATGVGLAEAKEAVEEIQRRAGNTA